MNVYIPSSVRPSPGLRRIQARRPASHHPLLWIAGVLAAATILCAMVLIAARLLSHEAVAVEVAPAQPDPFYQRKVDAKVEELPAQF